MAVSAIAQKPDGAGGRYLVYLHENYQAELRHRQPGKPIQCLAGKQSMYRVRAAMATLGITEDGWTPS